MTNSRRRYPALVVGAASLALLSCSTQEIDSGKVLTADDGPNADHGGLSVAFASREATFAEQQASGAAPHTTGYTFLDGRQVGSAVVNGPWEPFVVVEGGSAGIGYLGAGTHYFDIRAAGGGQTIFAADVEIPLGRMTHLYLFGPAGAVQGRFVSYPALPAVGFVHVTLINLVRTGQSVEVVGCTAATFQCAPLSPPLALGESFSADFPLDAMQGWLNGRYVTSSGLGLGYRQTPTAAVSNPPVYPLPPEIALLDAPPGPRANLTAAPVYVSPGGDIQASF